MKWHMFREACFFLILIAITETMGCDPRTGPVGVTYCFLGTPYYSKYQCGTCITDAYMIQKSGGRHRCRETATFCLYQCMLERHDIESGPVYADCECDPDRALPQPAVILPPSCYSPDGTDCDWYRLCLAKMFPCKGQVEYAISYGEKFCNLYNESESLFSATTQQWMDATRKCLQVELAPFLHLCHVNPLCQDIRKKAFDSHVSCYIEPYQGFSVCRLPFNDWAKIFWTIKSSFVLSAFVEAFKASLLSVGKCGGAWSSELAKYLYSISVQIWNKIRVRLPTSDTMSDDELAYAIMRDVNSEMRWDQDTTVDWYAFAAKISTIKYVLSMTSTEQRSRGLVIQMFVTDKVDIGLMHQGTEGRQRLNATITELSDVIKKGLTGTVGDYTYGVTSLRQCTSGDGVNNGCSNGRIAATGPSDFNITFPVGDGTVRIHQDINYWLFVIIAFCFIISA